MVQVTEQSTAPRRERKPKRGLLGRRRGRETATETVPEAAVTAEPKRAERRQLPVLRSRPRRRWLDRLGFYDAAPAGAPSTTKQIAGLHLAIAGAPTTPRGLFLGLDEISGWAVYHDIFQAYMDKLISSPNAIAIGDLGAGKSVLVKCWGVLRPLLLGRRVVVIDKKRQEGVGEYTPPARALGVDPIRFLRGKGGTCINILDPAIRPEGTDTEAGQTDLLFAVLTEALGRALSPKERKAVRVAHATALRVAAEQGRVPTIIDVNAALLNPDEQRNVAGVDSAEQLLEWGREAGFALEELIHDGPLAGLIDGPTSENVKLDNGLTVFDISGLPEDGPAIPIVMAIVTTWMRARMMSDPAPVRTHTIIEEGWHLVGGNFAKVNRRNMKVSRGAAQSHFTALQHVSDVGDDPDALAVIHEAETVFIFRQDKAQDARDCVRIFGLAEAAVDIIQQLPQGTCLMKIGKAAPILLSVVRSDIEAQLTDTDGAMASRATAEVSATLRDKVAAMQEGAGQ